MQNIWMFKHFDGFFCSKKYLKQCNPFTPFHMKVNIIRQVSTRNKFQQKLSTIVAHFA